MTQAIFPGLEDNAALVAVLVIVPTAVISALIATAVSPYEGYKLKDLLHATDERPLLIKRFRTGGSAAYFDAVRSVLDFADRFYGHRLVSAQSFGRCLVIANVYPDMALILGWMAFDAGRVGGVEFFTSQPLWWERLWRGLLVLASWALAYLIVRIAPRPAASVVSIVDRRLHISGQRTGFLAKAVRWTLENVVVAGASAGVVAGASAGVVAVAGAEFATVWTLFFVLLPVLNALADTVSVAATRFFLGHLVAVRPSPGRVLTHVFADLGIAGLCLAALICGFVGALALWDLFAPGTLIFDWRAYWADVQANPGHGTALWIMLMTTLIPTCVHVIAGIGALITHRSRLLRRVADDLELADGDLGVVEVDGLLRRIRRADVFGAIIATVIFVALSAAVFFVGTWFVEWFDIGS